MDGSITATSRRDTTMATSTRNEGCPVGFGESRGFVTGTIVRRSDSIATLPGGSCTTSIGGSAATITGAMPGLNIMHGTMTTAGTGATGVTTSVVIVITGIGGATVTTIDT